MGVRGMTTIAARLQEAGVSGDLSEAAVRLTELETEYERARPALLDLQKVDGSG
jgi:hypothetical protein